MARSLDRLIDFLLEEIALDGDQGVTLKEIATYVKKFYNDTADLKPNDSTLARSVFRLDEAFLARVWEWLVREDDILIDDPEDLKTWSFAQLRTQYPGVLDGVEFHQSVNGQDVDPKPRTTSSYCPRISVDTYRIHHAICGHGPDPSRVPASEYALLSVIARSREEGILQGVAGRLTGQDKRSVPKRTDLLHAKGYIVKKTVLAGGQKTSRLTLKRFAHVQDAPAGFLIRDLSVRVISTLRSDRFMTQDDLATILSFSDPARRRVLNQVVGQLVRRKCLKKVKAAFGPDSDVGELKICIQVVRELEEDDWAPQEQDNVSFTSSVDDAVLKAQSDIEATGPDANETADGADVDQEDGLTLQYTPQWNPDRLIPNVLWDLTANSGEEGITNTSARAEITGFSVRRPLESTLVRVSHASLKRQPAHVRELGIVRSTEVENAVARYVHRTFGTFRSLVQQNLATWSAVEGGSAFAKAHPDEANGPLPAEPERDEFGFPIRKPPVGQLMNGLVNLARVARVPEAKPFKTGAYEISIVDQPDGRFSLSVPAATEQEIPNSAVEDSSYKASGKATSRTRNPPTKKKITKPKHHPQGRPRKFTRGTEKFWRDMLLVRKLEDDPTFSRRSGLAGLTQDVELLDWYNHRPLQYDEIILLVLEQGLPLPFTSSQVSQSWIHQMDAYINRSGTGAFITPTGATKVLKGMFQCLVTIKTPRLRELDLQDRSQGPAVLFLASSIAHSFRTYDVSKQYKHGKKATKKIDFKVVRRVPDPEPGSVSGQDFSQTTPTTIRTYNSTPEPLPATPLKRKRKSDTDAGDAVSDQNVGALIVRPRRRKAAKLSHTYDEATALQEPPTTVSSQSSPQPPTGRSTRTRKLTQKAADSGVELQSARRRSSAISRQRPSLNKPATDGESQPIEKEAADGESLPHDSGVPGAAETNIETPTEYQWVLQPPDISATKNQKANENSSSVSEHNPSLGARESVNEDLSNHLTSIDSGSQVQLDSASAQIVPTSENTTEIASLTQTHVPSPHEAVKDNGLLGIHSGIDSQSINADSRDPSASEQAELSEIQPPQNGRPTPEPGGVHESATPATDEKPILKGRDAVEHYKIILLEIIHMCGGVVPNSPMLWRRAVRAKSFEAGVDDNPSVKLLRSQMNILATRGKVKVLNFAYQRNGMNYTKAIVALPHIQLSDTTFLSMQQKMIALPVEDEYIPPELQAEIDRKPSETVKRDLLASKIARQSKPKPKPPKKQAESQREDDQYIEPDEMSKPVELPNSPLPSPTPPPAISVNTGFLTLRVPKIGQIRTSNTFTSHYFDLTPATVIRFEADANAAAGQTALPTPASQRRSGVRTPRATTYQPGHGKIQWAVPKSSKPLRRLAIPTSLKSILSQMKEDGLELDSTVGQFERDLERVRIWEENNSAVLRDQRPAEWHFINHLIPKRSFANMCDPNQELAFLQVKIIDTDNDPDSLATEETDMPDEGSWEPFQETVAKARSKQKRANDAASKRKRKLDDVAEQDDDPDFAASTANTPARKGNRPKRQKKETSKAAEQGGTSKRTRGIGLRRLSKEDAQQVCISFVVVRVLTGGLDKFVDFGLIQRLNPAETETVLRERWKVLTHAYLTDLDAFTQDFQIKYLDALAEERVPSVNYNNIANTDWEGILQWALQNIDTSGKDVPLEIPPAREDFLALNKVDIIEPPPVRNLYHQGQNYTLASKEAMWCSTINGVINTSSRVPDDFSIDVAYPAELSETDINAARARSWILAAVLTKTQVYDSDKTRSKLRCLATSEAECDALLASTMKQMQNDKIIVRQDSSDTLNRSDGSSYSGTNGWKISRKWFDKLNSNRNITAAMLGDAVRYKLQVLDPAFARGQHVDLGRAPYLPDGCMVAIFNLLDYGFIRIVPGADVPMSRYGLDWEDQGYKTRSMDKDALAFSTYLQPTSAYIYGDPGKLTRSTVTIPRGNQDQEDGMGLIPAWFNINQQFQPQIWDMVVGAVIGIVALRPGISTLETLRNLTWAIQSQDLDMILRYLLDCKLIERVSEGWEVVDWWWTAIGTAHEEEADTVG